MTDIDQMLARLKDLPSDPRLATIDARVFDGVAELKARAALPGSAYGLALAIALFVGIAGSAIPGTSHGPSLLGTPPALAPSSLLDGPGE